MKKKIITRLFFICLTVLCAALSGEAQTDDDLGCREPKINPQLLNKLLQLRKQNANRMFTGTVQVRYYAHIISDDDGASPGADTADIRKELEDMNKDFSAGGMCFIYAGLNYIKSSLLNHINVDTHSDADDLFAAHNIPGCLNIYYVNQIRGTNSSSGGKIGGITFSRPSTFCVVSSTSLENHTSSHETGHCLGLPHTFTTANPEEHIARNNCYLSGDLFCDTDADPYYHKENQDDCFSSSKHKYTGYCEDPEGHSNYTPPYSNIMSYWHGKPQTFTTEQLDWVRSTIDNHSDLQDIISVEDLTIFPQTNHFGFIFRSAKNSITAIGAVSYLDATQVGLFAKKVIINPSFHAIPTGNGYTQIKANECSGTSFTAITYSENVKAKIENEQQANAGIKIYPNPSKGIFTIAYNSNENFNAMIIVRNVSGKIMYQSKNKMYYKQLRESINIGNVASGIYLAELHVAAKIITTKLFIE